jgi:hypothetical protein
VKTVLEKEMMKIKRKSSHWIEKSGNVIKDVVIIFYVNEQNKKSDW